MLGLRLSPTSLGKSSWWRAPGYRAENVDGGQVHSPSVVVNFRQRKYVQIRTPADGIAGAAVADLGDLQECRFADIFTFSRASAATYWDAGGILRSAAADNPRFDHTNGKPQLLLEGPAAELGCQTDLTSAVAGIVGSGGALPTGWSQTADTAGITIEVMGRGAIGVLSYVDLRMTGTPTAAWRLRPCATGGFACLASTQYVASAFVSLLAGSLTASALQIGAGWFDASTTYLSQSVSAIGNLVGNALSRQSFAVTSPSTAARASHILYFAPAIGTPVDFTLRLAMPNFTTGERASSPILSSGTATTRAADLCQFGTRPTALLGRSQYGAIIRGQGIWGSQGRLIGGLGTNDRLVGINSSQTSIGLGVSSGYLQVAAVSAPLPAFGIAVGCNASGKAGAYNGGVPVSDTSPLAINIASAYLGRDGAGNYFAQGWYDEVALYGFRPSTASLAAKAVPLP
ncbi:MAG: hypothetical protein RLZZ444_2175 [Pseudomonadota bacterium]|jgi:hypothetical protein